MFFGKLFLPEVFSFYCLPAQAIRYQQNLPQNIWSHICTNLDQASHKQTCFPQLHPSGLEDPLMGFYFKKYPLKFYNLVNLSINPNQALPFKPFCRHIYKGCKHYSTCRSMNRYPLEFRSKMFFPFRSGMHRMNFPL